MELPEGGAEISWQFLRTVQENTPHCQKDNAGCLSSPGRNTSQRSFLRARGVLTGYFLPLLLFFDFLTFFFTFLFFFIFFFLEV